MPRYSTHTDVMSDVVLEKKVHFLNKPFDKVYFVLGVYVFFVY